MKKLIEIALSQYGTKEIEGARHNNTIVNYAKESGFKWVNDDETPWCSIFANWCAMKSGLQRTKKANARSWLEIGEEVINPEIGDVVIFKRGSSSWQGHVAFYINESNGYINVLGGNQGNQVKISAYNKNKLLGFRRLKNK